MLLKDSKSGGGDAEEGGFWLFEGERLLVVHLPEKYLVKKCLCEERLLIRHLLKTLLLEICLLLVHFEAARYAQIWSEIASDDSVFSGVTLMFLDYFCVVHQKYSQTIEVKDPSVEFILLYSEYLHHLPTFTTFTLRDYTCTSG